MRIIVIVTVLVVSFLFQQGTQVFAWELAEEPNNPKICAIDSETFVVTYTAFSYLFKVTNNKIILEEVNDVYSTSEYMDSKSLVFGGKKNITTFKRLNLDVQ
jgi:hypothetical protein